MASWRKVVTKNIPLVDLQSYTILIAGGYKSGKTRMWKELIELLYPNNPDAGLLFAFEPGYKTWQLESFIPMHDYKWETFQESVKGLVEEAGKERITKIIGIDTADRCIDSCSEYILEKCYRKYGKKFDSLQDVGDQTLENGWIMLLDELNKQFNLLKNAGYGIVSLAWTKEKENVLRDGLKYNSLELQMSNTGRKVFESQADLVVCLYDEVKIMDKEGNILDENVTNKRGKEIASNFHTTETMMFFRKTNYINISGGRFLNLPEKVPYSVQNFMTVFENAVRGQISGDADIKKMKEAEILKREERSREFASREKSIEELVLEIEKIIQDMTPEQKQVTAVEFKKIIPNKTNNYLAVKDIDVLQKCLEKAKIIVQDK